MFCSKCGKPLSDQARFCASCGNIIGGAAPISVQYTGTGHVGFSPKINDPAFLKYIKNTKRWAFIFSFIMAAIAIIGFYFYGENGSEMDNPQALFIGMGLGGFFILIAVIQTIGKSRSTTWDGSVIDKKVERKRRKRYIDDDDYRWEDFTLFSVVFRSDRGKIYTRSVEDDDTQYNYYQTGDRVRHHKGLNTYEKFDKSRDSIIFCNACASLNEIQNDYCFRCKCPLLK